ncbi:MAG: hypothetical protein ACE5NC_08760 [Anaerolineae bacterium]
MATETLDAKLRVRELALKRGALAFGVAAAEAFDPLAPEGHRPRDLLPGARSVVVVGGAPPRAGDWISPVSEHLESMGTSQRIEPSGRQVAVFIEEELGHYALYVPGGVGRGNQPFLSLMLAAELAGLGARSLAGPILHEKYGMLYYAAVITTLALDPDRPLEKPVCPAPPCLEMWEREGTTPCINVCPAKAWGCLDGRIEDGHFVRTEYKRDLCHTRVYSNWIGGFQKVLEATLNEPDKEKRKMLLYGSLFTRTLWSITYSGQSQAQCFECIRVCPVGQEYRTKK